jgi:hypothetical protein
MISDSPVQIHKWGVKEPDANVCVYAQQVPGGLCFLDKDGSQDLRAAYERETKKQFPKTLLVRSSFQNGIEKGHWYFRQSPRTITFEKNITEDSTDGWFSLRVKNEYVCSIGSIHPLTGEPYKVVEDYPIIPMPDDLLDWLQSKVQRKPRTREEAAARGKLKKGTRYTALIAEVGRLWYRGWPRSLVISSGIEWARENYELQPDEGLFNAERVKKEIEHFLEAYPPGASEQKKQAAQALPLVVYDLIDFKTANFPPREALMVLDKTTMFTARSLNQIFAWRGTGKTMFALSLCGAMATGGKFLNLQATRAMKVLYVEGESPDAQMQERVKLLIGPTEAGFFRLITRDQQNEYNGVPSLSLKEGRDLLEAALGDSEILVLDSISTLVNIPTNEEEKWIDLLMWFARLRSRGLCLIFLHHAGKSGLQRGHSRSEDMLDISIKLSRAPEDEELDYLKFKMEYDKFRGDRTGVHALTVDYQRGTWSYSGLKAEKLAIVAEYMDSHPNASDRAIARALTELGTRPTVIRLIREVEKMRGKQAETS